MTGARPGSAQTVVLTASLTAGNEPVPPASPLIPFFDTTHSFGAGTITVDPSARTVSYSFRMYNLPGTVTGGIFVGGPGPAGVIVVSFAPPVPASVVLNNISDDVCYEIPAIAFDGTASAAAFVLRPELGIRPADDLLQAILSGNAYVAARPVERPDGEIRGPLVPKK